MKISFTHQPTLTCRFRAWNHFSTFLSTSFHVTDISVNWERSIMLTCSLLPFFSHRVLDSRLHCVSDAPHTNVRLNDVGQLFRSININRDLSVLSSHYPLWYTHSPPLLFAYIGDIFDELNPTRWTKPSNNSIFGLATRKCFTSLKFCLLFSFHHRTNPHTSIFHAKASDERSIAWRRQCKSRKKKCTRARCCWVKAWSFSSETEKKLTSANSERFRSKSWDDEMNVAGRFNYWLLIASDFSSFLFQFFLFFAYLNKTNNKWGTSKYTTDAADCLTFSSWSREKNCQWIHREFGSTMSTDDCVLRFRLHKLSVELIFVVWRSYYYYYFLSSSHITCSSVCCDRSESNNRKHHK